MSFDRIAPVYDALATLAFGRWLRRASGGAIAAGLPPTARHILVVGGGTGPELPAVLARCPAAQVVFVEASGAMLAGARARLRRHCPPADAARVTWHHGPHTDVAALGLPPFDAVLAFYFFDLFAPSALAGVLALLAATTTPDARWVVADFAPPRHGWQRGLLAGLYAFFGLTTGLRTRRLPDWPAALAAQGLVPLARQAVGPQGLLLGGVWGAGNEE